MKRMIERMLYIFERARVVERPAQGSWDLALLVDHDKCDCYST